VSNSRVARGEPFEFTLPDAGAGDGTLSSSRLAAEHDAVLVVLLRSHYCPRCRDIVQSFRDKYQSFASRSTAVIPVLPDSVERGALWQRRYELPFPVLTDPAGPDAESEFETFEPYERYLQSLPGAALFEPSEGELELVATFGGDGPKEFPSVESVLDEIDARTEGETGREAGPRADT
jgi:peroxiredoxin Q/BCP